ncbi:toxin C-terminal domain-containing protein [Vibrio gazogenes]|uniref:Novel toxin 21 domain-containing protein n=1 Tax=Vibrio gazogenes TaxID=687 RepID=A0A1Z2SL04_VIBGA|nr:toxin C-terminal domain-containing protein [Vibrio gazogenes]ASA57864.1 hypothetical protein BSQ33_19270 [Vibrio gazogenes]
MQIQHLTYSAMQALGYDPAGYENKIIAKDDDARKGFYSEETQKSYINDQNANNTEELVLIAGYEMSHAVDDKTGDVNRYSEQDREIYANNIGEDFTDYTDTALGVTGNGSMANRNSHVGNTGSTVVGNNQAYNRLDKSQGDNLIPLVIPAAVAITSITAAAIADPKVQQVTQQALTDAMAGAKEVGNGILNFFEPDAQYTDEELDIAAKAYLQMQEYRDSSTETGDWVEMDNLMQQVSAEVVAAAEKLRAEGISSNTGGSEIVEGRVTNYTNPAHEGIDSSTVSVADKDQGVWTTETNVTDEKGVGTTESPAESGVDVPLVVVSENIGDEFNPKVAANELGYNRRIAPQKAPFNSHGQPVFFNGKGYISPDVDSHNVTNGWKTFDKKGRRTGTWNSDLTKRIKD